MVLLSLNQTLTIALAVKYMQFVKRCDHFNYAWSISSKSKFMIGIIKKQLIKLKNVGRTCFTRLELCIQSSLY